VRVPGLVQRALALADELGFERTPENGALLHVLAGRRGVSRAGEIGTGCGVGAAWIVSALPPDVPFVTVELEPHLAAAASALFADDENVRVLSGGWREVLPPEAPFDFLFVDARDAKDDPDAVLGLLSPGATVVLDDFSWEPSQPDLRRDAWLEHPELAAVQVWTTPERRAIVAVRRR